MLKQEDIEYLLSLNPDDISKDLLVSFFADSNNGKAKFKQNDKFILDSKLLVSNNNPITKAKNIGEIKDKETTVGRYIVNLFLFGGKILDGEESKEDKPLISLISYRNIPIKSGELNNINKELSILFVDNKIGAETLSDFLDRLQWLGYGMAFFMHPSLDYKTIVPSSEIESYKKDIIKKNQDIIDEGRVLEFEGAIEQPILDKSSEILNKNGATGKIIYDSGYNGKFA